MSEVDLELEEFKKGFRQVDYSKLSREELNEEYDERSTLEKTAMAPVELAVGVVGGAGDLMAKTVDVGVDIVDATGLSSVVHDVVANSDLVQNVVEDIDILEKVETSDDGTYVRHPVHGVTDLYKGVTGRESGFVEAGSFIGSTIVGGQAIKGTAYGAKALAMGERGGKIAKIGADALIYAPVEVAISSREGGIVLGGETYSPLANRAFSTLENLTFGMLGEGVSQMFRSGKSVIPSTSKAGTTVEPKVQAELTHPSDVDISRLPDPALIPIQPLNTQYSTLSARLLDLKKQRASITGNKRQVKKQLKSIDERIQTTEQGIQNLEDSGISSPHLIGESITLAEDIKIREQQLFILKKEKELLDSGSSVKSKSETLRRKIQLASDRLKYIRAEKAELDALEFDVKFTKAETDPTYKAKLEKDTTSRVKKVEAISKAEKADKQAVRNKAVESGVDPKPGRLDGKETLEDTLNQRTASRQSVSDYSSAVDNFTEGKYDSADVEEAILDLLEHYGNKEIAPEIIAVRNLPFGSERRQAMRKVRDLLKSNPTILSEDDILEKLRFDQMVSDKIYGKKSKKVRSFSDAVLNIFANSKGNPKVSKALKAWSNDTGLAPSSILRVAGSVGVALDDLDSFIIAANKTLDEMSDGLVEASKSALSIKDAKGKIDVMSEEAIEYYVRLTAYMDFYDNLSGIKSNLGRGLNASRVTSSDIGSLVEDNFAKLKPKSKPTAKYNIYARTKAALRKKAVVDDNLLNKSSELELEKLLEDIDPEGAKSLRDKYNTLNAERKERLTAELYTMLNSTRSKGGVRKVFSNYAGKEVLSQDGTDIFIGAILGSILSTPKVLGRILGGTIAMGVNENIITPLFRNMVSSSRKVARKAGMKWIDPPSTKDTNMQIMRRVVAATKVLAKHVTDRKNLPSRGVLGMNIEGAHVYNMDLKTMNEVIELSGGVDAMLGHLAKYPLSALNMVTKNILIGIDDVARRMTLEMERMASVDHLKILLTESKHNIIKDGVQVNPFHAMPSDQFDEVMTSLLRDLGDTAVDVSKDLTKDTRKEFDRIFRKYGLTHELHEPLKDTILHEYSYVEKQGAVVVAQQTTNDLITGLASTGVSKAARDNRATRIMLAQVLPFVSSPLNIIDYGFQITPGLQPLSTRFWRALREGSQKERDSAIARLLGGMAFAGASYAWVSNHRTTGKLSPEERVIAEQEGYGDYHTEIGGKWWDYSWIGAHKNIIGACAQINNTIDAGDESLSKISQIYAMGAVEAVVDVPQFGAMAELTDLMRSNEKGVSRFVASKASMITNIYNPKFIADPLSLALNKGKREQSVIETEFDAIENSEFVKYLDNYNRTNPLWRIFRSGTSDKDTYEVKTDIFNRPIMDSAEEAGSLFMSAMGMVNKPVKNDLVSRMLADYNIMTKEFVESFDKVGEFYLRNHESDLYKEETWHRGEDPLIDQLRGMAKEIYTPSDEPTNWTSGLTPQDQADRIMDMIKARQQAVIHKYNLGNISSREAQYKKAELQKEDRVRGLFDTSKAKRDVKEYEATEDLLKLQKALEIGE